MEILISNDSYIGPVIDVTEHKKRIQELRTFAALLEAGFGLIVNNAQREDLLSSTHHTVIEFNGNVSDLKIAFNHEAPSVIIENIQAPVMFPEWLLDIGEMNKENVAGFIGIQDTNRIKYFLTNLPVKSLFWKNILASLSKVFCIKRGRVTAFFLNVISKRVFTKEVSINWSTAGRQQSNKLQDIEYFRKLSSFKIAICPIGDCPWSYRLLEAVLVGAIPMTENDVLAKRLELYVVSDLSEMDVDASILENNKKKVMSAVFKKSELRALAEKISSKDNK